MKVLVLFAVGALLGTVSCYESYSACFEREFSECADRAPINQSLCSDLKAQVKCTLRAAQECDMGFIQEAYKVQQVVNRACFDEVEEHFMRDRRCFGRAVGDGHCIKRIDEIMKGRNTLKEILEGHKESCMQVDWFKRCMVTNVEDNCGGVSEDYFSTFLDPLVALHKHICREVIFSMDENTSFLIVYGVPSVFDIIIDIFTEI
ncbi:hypothetical protein AVEN_272794-1 [Araneus ventricosus]|uniref:DUF19 domain-containing protein n=1 Tax=Araneus ventricosus TaxID=182803 RepID=A0A4Y2RFV4_ARAVE|nr:hypothetical protein AVEN_272794-1 [Araneus ventricosus]